MEVAIFGGICVAAIGFLLRVGLQMQYDQEIRMAAFRHCLNAAQADNDSFDDARGVSYLVERDRRMPNPSGGGLSMPRSATLAAAYCEHHTRATFGYMVNPGTGEGPGEQRIFACADNSCVPSRQHEWPRGALANDGFIISMTTGTTNQEDIGQSGSGQGSTTTWSRVPVSGTTTNIVLRGGPGGVTGGVGSGNSGVTWNW